MVSGSSSASRRTVVDFTGPRLRVHTGPVQQTISAELPAAAEPVYDLVSDLATYPRWLGLVSKVDSDGEGAWWVTLRAKLGPLARSKRLRMERVTPQPRGQVRFERREQDGRVHANWVLDVAVMEIGDDRSRLTMNLSYDGGLWSRPLEIVLKRQVDDAVPRLRELVAGP
jgi:hypothetical protein